MIDCAAPVFARLGCRDRTSWLDGSKLDYANFGFAIDTTIALGDFYGHCYMNVNPLVAPLGGMYVQYGRWAGALRETDWSAPVAVCQIVVD